MKKYNLPLISALLLGSLVVWGASSTDEIILPGPGQDPIALKIYSANSDTRIAGKLEEADGQYIWHLNDGIECRVRRDTAKPDPTVVEYEMTLTATGDAHCLYRVELTGDLSSAVPDKWNYWNGAREYPLQENIAQEHHRFTDTFPLSVIENGRDGFALGIAPYCEFSSFASRALAANRKVEQSISTKLVVDGIHPQRIRFLAIRFTPEFGWRDAVQRYYDRYPEAFRPLAGVDERLYGNGGYLGLFQGFNGFELHPRRYDRIGWEWSYAPWVKAGNWYPEENDDLEQLYRSNSDRIGELPRNAEGNVTWATYNRIWKEHFASADRRIAMFYYIYVNDIHHDILDRYPDARFHNADSSFSNGGSSSIESDRGKTGYAFAQGSGLQQELERKIRLAAENYAISGFAFDMANNFAFDYSPAQLRNGRYRTFDADGKICTGNFANPVLFAEYIHTLVRDGRRMGTCLNFGVMGITPPSAFAADAVIFEGTPADNVEQVFTERLLTGRKPLYFWGDVTNHGSYSPLNWPILKQSPQKMEQISEQMAQLELFLALRYGISMQSWAAVHPVIKPWIDTILALQKLGWNPVPALHDSSGKLWIGRFGSGLQTVFTVLNPEREPVTAKLELVDSYLGNGKFIPVPEDGALTVDVAEKCSIFELTIPPKGIRVFTVAAVTQPGDITVNRDDAAGSLHASSPLAILPVRDYARRSYLAQDATQTSFIAIPGVIDATATLPSALRPGTWIDASQRPTLVLGAQSSRNSQIITDMFDWYLPFRKKNPVPADRVAYDAFDYSGIDPVSGRFARGLSGDQVSGWRIAIGTPEELGWTNPFTPDIAGLPDQGLILMDDRAHLLWLTGTTSEAVKESADRFFSKLDQVAL